MSETLWRLAGRRALVSGLEDVVVVIEDDDRFREILEYLFKHERIRALFAADGRTGLALIRRHRPKVVLLDVFLPHLSGYEVVDDVRKDPRLREILVVAMTGMAIDDEELRSLKGKADVILSKPIDEHEMLDLIRAGLETAPGRSGLKPRRPPQGL